MTSYYPNSYMAHLKSQNVKGISIGISLILWENVVEKLKCDLGKSDY